MNKGLFGISFRSKKCSHYNAWKKRDINTQNGWGLHQRLLRGFFFYPLFVWVFIILNGGEGGTNNEGWTTLNTSYISANQLLECFTYKDIASSEDIKLKFCGTQLGKTRQMFFSFLSSDLGRDGCFCFRFLSCKERSMLSEFARCWFLSARSGRRLSINWRERYSSVGRRTIGSAGLEWKRKIDQ